MIWDNDVNIMADDAMAFSNARPSTITVLGMQDEQVLVFHNE